MNYSKCTQYIICIMNIEINEWMNELSVISTCINIGPPVSNTNELPELKKKYIDTIVKCIQCTFIYMNIIQIKTTKNYYRWAVQHTLCAYSIYFYILPILANLRQKGFFAKLLASHHDLLLSWLLNSNNRCAMINNFKWPKQ